MSTPKTYAFDLETWLIEDGILAPPLVVASLAQPRARTERLLLKRRALQWLRIALKRPDVHLVGQNIAYDLGVSCAEDPDLIPLVYAALDAGRIHDTGIRESLLDIARGQLGVDPNTGRQLDDDEGVKYSLAVLVKRYLGLDISADKNSPDAWRLRYRELDGVPLHRWPEEAKRYPKADARLTLDVYLAQEEAAKTVVNGGNLHDEARSVYNAFVLHLISLHGLRTSGPKVQALEVEVEAKHLKAQEEFKKVGIVREDGTENKKRVQELVSLAYHGNPPLSPKGGIATDRDTKIESGDPILIAHGTSGKNNKYRTTYLPKLFKGTTRPINPKFYGMAATTRVTSDYQQLPQKGGVRECHEARRGTVYCSVDYGGLELRTMSQRAIWEPEVGFSKMAEALLSGKDTHCVAAAEFLGTSYEEAFKRYKAKDPVADSMRKLGKVFNFGKGGGMGPKTLAYHARAKDNVRFCQLAGTLPSGKCGSEGYTEVKVRGQEKRVCEACIEDASRLDGKWLDAWEEQKLMFAISSRLHRGGMRTEVPIPIANIIRGECGYTQWLNTPFQGMGAVLTTLAMRRISKEMYTDKKSPLYGSRLVLNVHDELIAELLERSPMQLHDAAERMALLMREAAKECLPDLAGAIEAEPALSRILSKDASTVRDSNGMLLVWEPTAKKAA